MAATTRARIEVIEAHRLPSGSAESPAPGTTIDDRKPEPVEHTPSLSELVASSGLRHVHILAWRDLDDPEAGGSEIHAATVARLWSEAGLEVTMRTSYAQGQPPETRRDGYRVIRRSGRHLVFPSTIASELMGWHGPCDAILEVWNGVPFFSPLWARRPHAVVIHHVHKDMWDLVVEPRLASLGRLIELRLAPPWYRHTPIITVSPSSRRNIIELLGLPPESITVASPGIGAQFRPGSERASAPTILAVGRLMPPKRFDELVRIAAELRDRIPDLRLVIAGEGYAKTELVELVRALDATDWVRIAGRVSDEELVSLYQTAWVVASASIAEGFGLVMVEAGACGTPAVATRITGHEDTVVHGATGLLGADPRELTTHLERILTDADLRERLGAGALAHASQYNWEATARGTFAPLVDAPSGWR